MRTNWHPLFSLSGECQWQGALTLRWANPAGLRLGVAEVYQKDPRNDTSSEHGGRLEGPSGDLRIPQLVDRPSDSISGNAAFRIGIGPAEGAGVFGVGPDVPEEFAP